MPAPKTTQFRKKFTCNRSRWQYSKLITTLPSLYQKLWQNKKERMLKIIIIYLPLPDCARVDAITRIPQALPYKSVLQPHTLD